MKLRYSSGHKAVTRSFFIPIGECNALKVKSRHFDRDEIPEWQKRLLAERIEAYKNGLEDVFDAEEVFKDIEKDLY